MTVNNIIDCITEPRFKQMMVKLSKASTEKEVDEIISEHNQTEMSDTEKQQYSDNVIADLENVLKALDSNMEELCAAHIREKWATLTKPYPSHISQRIILASPLQSALNDLGRKLSSIVLI